MKIIPQNKSFAATAILSKWLVISFLFLHGNVQFVHAQRAASRDYQLKSVFLFNFTKFVNWPPAAFADAQSPFIIGIAGIDPFGSYMDETIYGEKVLGHPVYVERYNELKDIKKCHILFINDQDPVKIKEMLAVATNFGALTVSDTENFSELGGMISFKTVNNKIKLLINVNAAKAGNLTISSKLLRVAALEN